MRTSISKRELMEAVHPTEDSRFALALILCVPAVIIALVILYNNTFAVIFFVGFLVLMFWLLAMVLKYSFIANSIRVSDKNFPELQQIAEEIKELIDYRKDLPIFIVQEGTINAFIAKFFNVEFIILNSGLVETMNTPENSIQLKWIIARFVGSLKVKQFRGEFLMFLVNVIHETALFSFFILPYQRATQYSGDNIGFLLCEDIEQVMMAFNGLMVGKYLAKDVNFEGLLEQGVDIRGNFFAFIARVISTHPHTVSRYLNLLAFAEKFFPEEFEDFTNALNTRSNRRIGALLPKYYK